MHNPREYDDFPTSPDDIQAIVCIENPLSGPFTYVGAFYKLPQITAPVFGFNLDSGSFKGTLL
jgi:hypothetical protein